MRIRHLLCLLAVLVASTGLAASNAMLVSAAAPGPTIPDRGYQVVHLSPSGQVVSTQPVSKATFMQIRDHVRQQAAQQAPARTGGGVTPFINRVPDQDCANRSDFFKLWNNTTIANGVCFANNGTININVYNVYEVDSGNNSGNFTASPNAHFPGNGKQMCSYTYAIFENSSGQRLSLNDVTQVSIVGRSTPNCQPSTVYII
jgi:Beta/Gamma crystallin